MSGCLGQGQTPTQHHNSVPLTACGADLEKIGTPETLQEVLSYAHVQEELNRQIMDVIIRHTPKKKRRDPTANCAKTPRTPKPATRLTFNSPIRQTTPVPMDSPLHPRKKRKLKHRSISPDLPNLSFEQD